MGTRKILVIFMMVCLCLGLAACGTSGAQKNDTDTKTETELITENDTSSESADNAEEQSEEQTDALAEGQESTEVSSETEDGSDVLVVYFSATGTTKGVAERIAAAEGADTYEIIAADPYSSDDLNYNDSNSRTTKEQNDSSVRPEIGSEDIDLSGYTRIYIGYPIWWGEEPRIMDTFVEKYDFGDAVVIPFCTSQGSGIGRSGTNLSENAGSGNWQDGDRLQSSISDAELQNWIDSFK